jgi:uncharacterized protein (TIGR02594 family)
LGDILWGLAKDDQEKEIENMQTLFDHVYDNYQDYFEKSKTDNISITDTKYSTWNVRSFSHQNKVCKSIYSKLTRNESPAFNLSEKGIFVEKYKMGEKEYNVAVYSFLEDITLKRSDIKLSCYRDLAENTSIKAGYTKKYGLITFYDESKNTVMLLQLWGDNPEEDIKQWLNYLGIVVASEEQKKRDENIWEKLKTNNLMLYAIEKLKEIWEDTEEEKTEITYLPWMNYAISEAKTMEGVTECEEPLYSQGNEYHSQGGHATFCICSDKQHSNYCDPNAWCASFVNWCLRQSNTSYTKSTGSQSFLSHSEFVKVSEPVFGAIAVFTNLDGNGDFKTTGHVAFVVGKMKDNKGEDQVLCLGGNQSQTIKVSQYSLKSIKGARKNQLYFRGYYIPKTYTNKLNDYKTSIVNYTDADIANQQIINLNINSTENESTR